MFGRHATAGLVSLEARAVPAPIAIMSSGNFLGNDGNWSTFPVRIGTPAQSNDVLISTLSTELWAVGDFACSNGANSDPNCATSRGGDSGLFASENSNTWNYTQSYSFAIDAQLIPQSSGQSFGGNYGYDTIGLSPASGSGNAVLSNQIVATMSDSNIWLGLLGLSPRMPNFASNNTQGSYLTNLYNQSKIPSLSYSYTAGAYYRGKTNASLTLGGYDTSRFNDPGLYVSMGSDSFHDLVIGVQGIGYSENGNNQLDLTNGSGGFLAMIDSTVTPLWLPQKACDQFQQAFGLSVDSLTQLYVYPNETVHQNNIKTNATVTFTLGSNISGGSTTNISFPYAAFDYYYTNPTSSQGPRAYFPLRVAGQSSLYTLGRVFLQEAVLTADYGRKNFTIAQALPVTSSTKSNIVAISNSTASGGSGSNNNGGSGTGGSGSGSGGSGSFVNQPASSGGSSGISGGAIAGIVIGALAGVALIGAALFFFFRRRRNAAAANGVATEKQADDVNGGNVPGGSPPPVYTGAANDYFGQPAQKTATTNTPHQLNKSMPPTPAISEPGGQYTPGGQYAAPAEMSAATAAAFAVHNASAAQHANPANHNPNATVNDLGWQHYNQSYLAPGSAATTPGVGPSVPVELSGSAPRDMPHEMQSPTVLPHEMPSPDPNAAELASPVSSSGRISPLPVSAVTPTTAGLTGAGSGLPGALAPAPSVASPGGSSMHHSQRSSATLPHNMQPTMHDAMPANAAQNVTAAEMAGNRTTMFSDTTDVSPDPESVGGEYFGTGEPAVSRNTSVASAVAQPVNPTRGKLVTHTRSPSSGDISRITEEASGEHAGVTPP